MRRQGRMAGGGGSRWRFGGGSGLARRGRRGGRHSGGRRRAQDFPRPGSRLLYASDDGRGGGGDYRAEAIASAAPVISPNAIQCASGGQGVQGSPRRVAPTPRRFRQGANGMPVAPVAFAKAFPARLQGIPPHGQRDAQPGNSPFPVQRGHQRGDAFRPLPPLADGAKPVKYAGRFQQA